ncbi:Fic family protein [Paenibacillus algorifonticola]|uniref:Fic family protein n=1 Tax=Paenibacillus algorifonticola TaxID=684063 RepID=A0A1I2H8G3_9BACL|nr:Fic family protein [Paenibacillus algorifonticola]SFF24911.1 Fic family protein [Paenibacillus algorifonticola]
MRHIYKVFHEKSAGDFHEVYLRRVNHDSTMHLGLKIKPMNQPQIYELYYVPTNKMIMLISKIHSISNHFQKIFEALPKVARRQFINECLVEELFNTNDLEGIRSTREEIARSAKEIKLNKKSKKRFESMIKSYMRLVGNEIEFPKTPQHLRKIYDDITNKEIDQDELPDGEIFRKEVTYILKKSGTGKVVHQGITPEKEIIQATEQLLKFMNENDEIPAIIKVAIGHYYFGYIHPFYDGNGRTSRFISSMYLSEALGNISTLSLSRGCNKYKNKYLEAFEFTNSIKSRGEMNGFIEVFLEIILEALIQMNAELKEKDELLKIADKKLGNDSEIKNKEVREIMFVLAQNHFFDSGNGLTIKELAGIFAKSEVTIRKSMKELLALSLIEQRGERPAYFCIRQTYFET